MMRATAKKVTIWDLVNGKFVRDSDRFPGNYVITPYGVYVSRARIMGLVVDKFVSDDWLYATLTIDDSTETIRLKFFREDTKTVQKFKIGDLVDVIGRVREYQGEIYILPEIIKKVDSFDWELLRKLEIMKERLKLREIKEEFERELEKAGGLNKLEETLDKNLLKKFEGLINYHKISTAESIDIDELKEQILEKIKELDSGQGVAYEELLKALKVDEKHLDAALSSLLEEGEIYEPISGYFKRLE